MRDGVQVTVQLVVNRRGYAHLAARNSQIYMDRRNLSTIPIQTTTNTCMDNTARPVIGCAMHCENATGKIHNPLTHAQNFYTRCFDKFDHFVQKNVPLVFLQQIKQVISF